MAQNALMINMNPSNEIVFRRLMLFAFLSLGPRTNNNDVKDVVLSKYISVIFMTFVMFYIDT